MKKKYIIKDVLHSSILSLNSYGSYSLVNVSDIYQESERIKFFNSKEEAEYYVLQNKMGAVTIVEIFL